MHIAVNYVVGLGENVMDLKWSLAQGNISEITDYSSKRKKKRHYSLGYHTKSHLTSFIKSCPYQQKVRKTCLIFKVAQYLKCNLESVCLIETNVFLATTSRYYNSLYISLEAKDSNPARICSAEVSDLSHAICFKKTGFVITINYCSFTHLIRPL